MVGEWWGRSGALLSVECPYYSLLQDVGPQRQVGTDPKSPSSSGADRKGRLWGRKLRRNCWAGGGG